MVSFQFPALGWTFWTNPWAISAAIAVLAICMNHTHNHALAQAGSSAISSLRLSISNFWSSQILERIHMKWRPITKRSNSIHSAYSNRLTSAWISLSPSQRKTTQIWVIAIFFVLVASNSFGLIPLFSAVTGQAGTTLGLSLALWTAVTLAGIQRLRGRFVKLFLPGGLNWQMVPVFILLESISYTFRAISLGVRLWANMVAGHQLIHIVSALTLAPLLCLNPVIGAPIGVLCGGLLMFLTGLETIVCVLQSGVFCLLAGVYLTEALSRQDPLAQPSNSIKNKRSFFFDSLAVERLAVNQLVKGSNPFQRVLPEISF